MPMKKLAAAAFVVSAAACSGSPAADPAHPDAPPAGSAVPQKTTNVTAPRVRPDLHCTQSTALDEEVCKKKGEGCALGPPLHCHGTPPPPDMVEAERREYEASSEPCACVCPEDQKRCRETP